MRPVVLVVNVPASHPEGRLGMAARRASTYSIRFGFWATLAVDLSPRLMPTVRRRYHNLVSALTSQAPVDGADRRFGATGLA